MKPTPPSQPATLPDPAAPWFTPGPEKEAWKKLPGNRYTAEELERELADTTCTVTMHRRTRRFHIA